MIASEFQSPPPRDVRKLPVFLMTKRGRVRSFLIAAVVVPLAILAIEAMTWDGSRDVAMAWDESDGVSPLFPLLLLPLSVGFFIALIAWVVYVTYVQPAMVLYRDGTATCGTVLRFSAGCEGGWDAHVEYLDGEQQAQTARVFSIPHGNRFCRDGQPVTVLCVSGQRYLGIYAPECGMIAGWIVK